MREDSGSRVPALGLGKALETAFVCFLFGSEQLRSF